MTTQKTTKSAPKTNKLTTSTIQQGFIAASSDLIAMRDEITAKRVKEFNLDEKASRKEIYGESGMLAECHARSNAYLSGMTSKACQVFKLFDKKPELMAKIPAEGGLSREHKLMVMTICECIAQGKRPADLDLSKITEAARKVDSKFPQKRNGHNSIALLIETLKNKKTFTVNYWAHECNGTTQANYIMSLIKKLGLGTVSGSNEAKAASINTEHEIIKKLLAL